MVVESGGASKGRIHTAYFVLLTSVGTAIAASLLVGERQDPPSQVLGRYELQTESDCLGKSFTLGQSGQFVTLQAAKGGGSLRAAPATDGRTPLSGEITCPRDEESQLTVEVNTDSGEIMGEIGDDQVSAVRQVTGIYQVQSKGSCLGESFALSQTGNGVLLESEGGSSGDLTLQGMSLTGDVVCADGSPEPLRLTRDGYEWKAQDSGNVFAVFKEPLPETGEKSTTARRSGEETFGRLMLAIATVILAARLFGAAMSRIGQPRVMGEVLAGILLGPTLLARFAPAVTGYLFPPDIIPLLSAGADIGLAFYMFLVGMELDPGMLKGRVEQAAFISHGSIAIPMALGIATAVPIYGLVGPADKGFVPFAVFMGVSMSITAFPVLARILLERRMFRRPVGAMAIGAAAVDDVSAWGLLALSTAIAGSGSTLGVVRVIALAGAFCAVMALVVRRLLGRLSEAYDEAGHIPGGWIATIFVGVLISAFLSQAIGIAAIFGAFVMGLIMPRRADLSHEVSERLEDFVVTVLLPLFFVVTGLKTEVGLLDRLELWLLTLVLILVAVVSKWFGAMGAARFTGFTWRESAAIGALMNTRGLTELIVLTIGLELGVITPALFTMLVMMALVTTFMTGPALRLIDPNGDFSSPLEEELRSAEQGSQVGSALPERSILVAPQDQKNLNSLLSIAAPLARSEPMRELIMALLLQPARAATGGFAREERELARAIADLNERRKALLAQRLSARAVVFTSPDPGEDIARLASEDEVDLVLIDGRRPLVGEGVPRGVITDVLEKAPCDVAVLVERGGVVPEIGPHNPVLVPFGGADHDWAALELGAWIASRRSASLKLAGSRADVKEGRRDASRLLGNASLVIQQFIGIAAEPVLIEPGREGILEAAAGAGLLVVGLSERWREEGLGPVRSEIAKAVPAPTLFVRRGTRPGALAPPDNVTRFTWSSVAPPEPE